MDTFNALSATIRREILMLIADNGELSATAIAKKFKVTPSAISQHLKILSDSRLVQMHRDAQQRIYEVNPIALLELEKWAQDIVKQLNSLGVPTTKHTKTD
ncbi:MAG TPA: metalloregulator ArsR/SmtB family transcription factor [Candidatus Saccharimonadales bacterium]